MKNEEEEIEYINDDCENDKSTIRLVLAEMHLVSTEIICSLTEGSCSNSQAKVLVLNLTNLTAFSMNFKRHVRRLNRIDYSAKVTKGQLGEG